MTSARSRSASATPTLLARHVPRLCFDSGEAWLPVSAEAFLGAAVDGRTPVYGRAARGSDGRLWLAYWFLYAVNDYTLLGPLLHVGRHQGDWEMVQLRLGADDVTPELMLAAQHARVGAAAWASLERVPGALERPVLYPSRGAHANWFTPGRHWSGAWWDRADGRGPTVDPVLEPLDEQPWLRRRERWGGTPPRGGFVGRLGLAAASPHGPAHQRQWRDPAVLLAELRRPIAAPGGG